MTTVLFSGDVSGMGSFSFYACDEITQSHSSRFLIAPAY
jgi:hypothetical protein